MTHISNIDPFFRPTLVFGDPGLTSKDKQDLLLRNPPASCGMSFLIFLFRELTIPHPNRPLQTPPRLLLCAHHSAFMYSIAGPRTFIYRWNQSLRRSLAILPLAQHQFSFESSAQPIPLIDHRQNEKGIIFPFTKRFTNADRITP